jgi:hypothetical protein
MTQCRTATAVPPLCRQGIHMSRSKAFARVASRRLRRCIAFAICIQLTPDELRAQFVTAVPRFERVGDMPRRELQARFERANRNALTGQLAKLSDDPQRRDDVAVARAALEAAKTKFCAEVSEAEKSLCASAIESDGMIARRTLNPENLTTKSLPFRFPGFHSQSDIAAYLRQSSASDDSRLFARFAANISDTEAYVVTDVVSGLAGRTIVAIDYAAVVVKSESGTDAERKTVEDNTATTLRMVMNGGTLTTRLQLPVSARAGSTIRFASSVYGTGGFIGSISDRSSMHAAASINAEATAAFTIVAGRVGAARSERELLPSTNNRGLGYAQLAVGLRQGEGLTLSTLSTWIFDPAFKKYMPRLIVNFTAVR